MQECGNGLFGFSLWIWPGRLGASESHARNARQTVTLTREVSMELELSGNRPYQAIKLELAGSDPWLGANQSAVLRAL